MLQELLARVALRKIRDATTIDASVAAFAVPRTGIVFTSDVDDFHALPAFFRALRVFAIGLVLDQLATGILIVAH